MPPPPRKIKKISLVVAQDRKANVVYVCTYIGFEILIHRYVYIHCDIKIDHLMHLETNDVFQLMGIYIWFPP